MWSRDADGVTIIVYEWQAMEGTCSDRNSRPGILSAILVATGHLLYAIDVEGASLSTAVALKPGR